MLFIEEPRIKYTMLTIDTAQARQRERWNELRELERLQKSLRAVQARLGLRLAAG